MVKYVHGYSARETERLYDQSSILEDILHTGTVYPPGSRVLEVGCGTGGQTVILTSRSPGAEITSVDLSPDSLSSAKAMLGNRGAKNVAMLRADVFHLPFEDRSFDHVFVCFLLEHLEDPVGALAETRRVMRDGGSITVIEGDHGSCFWHPHTEESLGAWECLIRAQADLGHDSLVGRRLYPLLVEADFDVLDVSPRSVYADASNPVLLDGVVNRIMVPMVETARERALEMGLVDRATWERGLEDLRRCGDPPAGTIFYTWFKGIALKA